jgi:hypothetical protein
MSGLPVLILRSIAQARCVSKDGRKGGASGHLRDAREERAPQDEVEARLDMISFKEALS